MFFAFFPRFFSDSGIFFCKVKKFYWPNIQQILEGGPTGQPIKYAVIGEQVYHKWTCDSETVDTFCAVVHSCFVDDGNGDAVTLLDDSGCALDKYLLNNLEYPTGTSFT